MRRCQLIDEAMIHIGSDFQAKPQIRRSNLVNQKNAESSAMISDPQTQPMTEPLESQQKILRLLTGKMIKLLKCEMRLGKTFQYVERKRLELAGISYEMQNR